MARRKNKPFNPFGKKSSSVKTRGGDGDAMKVYHDDYLDILKKDLDELEKDIKAGKYQDKKEEQAMLRAKMLIQKIKAYATDNPIKGVEKAQATYEKELEELNKKSGNRGGNRGGDRGGNRGGDRGGNRGGDRGGNRGGNRDDQDDEICQDCGGSGWVHNPDWSWGMSEEPCGGC